MIKRQDSASITAMPSPQSSDAAAPEEEADDHNGKDKYQRHGSIFESIQRWMARNGKFLVICGTALMLSVFLIPPLKLKVIFNNVTTSSSQPATKTQQQKQQQLGSNSKRIAKKSSSPTSATRQQQTVLQIPPPCPSSPWKANENLQGKCPGDLKPYKEATTISHCASSCCTNPECISWQYRQDVGCIQGKDIRLGMEKDGPSAWCSDHPPHRWQGQFLKPHGAKNKGVEEKVVRSGACNGETWDPNEEIGQCFGLGDVKKDASGSAEECRMACCEKEDCGAWQWNKEVS